MSGPSSAAVPFGRLDLPWVFPSSVSGDRDEQLHAFKPLSEGHLMSEVIREASR